MMLVKRLNRKFVLLMVKIVINHAYRNKFLAKLFLGISFGPIGPDHFYYDLSTLAVVKKARHYINKDSLVIDMGTGAFGVIGLSLWKKTGAHVLSVDINENLVDLARKNIELNKAPIKVIQSDFFTNVDEDFDVVTWNPPYVYPDTAKYLNLSANTKSQWDGGKEGTAGIQRFLDTLANLKHSHSFKVFLGINAFYVPKEVMVNLIEPYPNILVDEISSHYFSFFNVYVLTVKK